MNFNKELITKVLQRFPTTTSRHWSRRFPIILLSTVTCGLLVALITTHDPFVASYSKLQWQWSVEREAQERAVKFPFAWRYLMHDSLSDSFTADNNETYYRSPDAAQWSNLGKKVLIMDVDSRLDLGKGAMLNPDPLDRWTIKPRTAGILNHFLYALIHGYDYRLVRPPNYTDRHGTWVKVPVIQEALKTHDIVVFLDADAIFRHIDLPLEWLMGHWNFTENTLLAAPIDIEQKSTHDQTTGDLMWNTGFVIAQQSEQTQEMFRRWEDCPTDHEYEGCSYWKENWAHEQAAFANYIRYSYNQSGLLQPIPCNEANGSPVPRGNCRGVFIRHYWKNKNLTLMELFEQLSMESVQYLHQLFHSRKNDFFVDASHLVYPIRTGELVI